jgi:hypothetical protein
MSTIVKRNRVTEEAGFNKAINGIAVHITTPILLGAATRTPAQITADLTGALQADLDLDAAERAVLEKRQARDAAVATARTTLASLKAYAIGAYGKANPILKDFGFPLSVPKVVPVATKAAAQKQSASTRVARHTVGPKKKLTIHGDAAPAAEPQGPAPAPTPPANGK